MLTVTERPGARGGRRQREQQDRARAGEGERRGGRGAQEPAARGPSRGAPARARHHRGRRFRHQGT